MASLVLAGDTSGSITVSAPAVAGSTTQTLVNVTGTLAPIVSGTAVTASGTSVDFTGIPSWVKRITVMFRGVSTTGTSNYQIQLGAAGGFAVAGYSSSSSQVGGANQTSGANSTTGLLVTAGTGAANAYSGVITLVNVTGNAWACAANLNYPSAAFLTVSAGSADIGATLTQIRITTVGGTDTFDAGTINILYE